MGLIANISKGTGLGGATAYVMDKPGAERLHVGNMAGRDVESLVRAFGRIRAHRPDIQRACFHAALSTDQELDVFQWEEACERYIEALGYSNSQWFAVRHGDTDHDHVHIVANAINYDLERVVDSKDYYKSQGICAEIEKDFGLEAAPRERPHGLRTPKHYEWRLEQDGEVPIKKQLQNRVGSAIDAAVDRGGSMKLLVRELDQRSVDLKVRRDSDGVPRGAIFVLRHNGEAMSGSSLARNWSWGKLQSKAGLDYELGRDDRWLDESTERADISMFIGGFGELDVEMGRTDKKAFSSPTLEEDFELTVGQLDEAVEQDEQAAATLEQDDPWDAPTFEDVDFQAEMALSRAPLAKMRARFQRKKRLERVRLIRELEARLRERARQERREKMEQEVGVLTAHRRLEQIRAARSEDGDTCINDGEFVGRIVQNERYDDQRLVVFDNGEGEWSYLLGAAEHLEMHAGGWLTVDYDKMDPLSLSRWDNLGDWLDHKSAIDVLAAETTAEVFLHLRDQGLFMRMEGEIEGRVAWTKTIDTRSYGHSSEEAKQRTLAVVIDKKGRHFSVLNLAAEHGATLEKGQAIHAKLGPRAKILSHTPSKTTAASKSYPSQRFISKLVQVTVMRKAPILQTAHRSLQRSVALGGLSRRPLLGDGKEEWEIKMLQMLSMLEVQVEAQVEVPVQELER